MDLHTLALCFPSKGKETIRRSLPIINKEITIFAK